MSFAWTFLASLLTNSDFVLFISVGFGFLTSFENPSDACYFFNINARAIKVLFLAVFGVLTLSLSVVGVLIGDLMKLRGLWIDLMTSSGVYLSSS